MADPSTLGADHWWRADNVTLTSGRVSAWPDLIGSADWAQSNASFRPVIASAHVNGEDAILFTAANSERFELSDPTTAPKSVYELWVTLRLQNDPPAAAAAALWSLSTAASTSNYPWTDGIIYEGAFAGTRQTFGNPTASLAAYHTYTILRRFGTPNSTTTSLRARTTAWINGTRLFNSTTFFTYSAPATWLFGRNSAGQHLNGWVADFAVFNRELPPWDRLAMMEYIQNRYAIWTPTSSTVRVTQAIVEVAFQVTAPPGIGNQNQVVFIG